MPSKLLGTYDVEKLSILLNEREVYGLAEGSVVSVERNQDFFINHTGVRGEVSRAVVRDNSGLITIRLQMTSPFCGVIERMKTLDAVMQVGGIGAPPVVTFRVVDPSSNVQVMASYVWLQSQGTIEWSNEVGVMEYRFFAVNITTAPNEALSVLQNIASLTGVL